MLIKMKTRVVEDENYELVEGQTKKKKKKKKKCKEG
jgi:hypothetical protein